MDKCERAWYAGACFFLSSTCFALVYRIGYMVEVEQKLWSFWLLLLMWALGLTFRGIFAMMAFGFPIFIFFLVPFFQPLVAVATFAVVGIYLLLLGIAVLFERKEMKYVLRELLSQEDPFKSSWDKVIGNRTKKEMGDGKT